MKEPVRWRESGTDDVRALLEHASRPRPMGAQEFARGERRVARLAAVPLGFGLLFWLKGIALGAGIGAVAVVGVVAVQNAQTRSATLAEGPVPTKPSSVALHSDVSVIASSPTPQTSDSSPPPAARASQEIRPPAPEPDDADGGSQADTLAQEAALVESARDALGSDPARALVLTVEHAHRFPGGQLGMESELVAIEALQKLGRGAEARARADALLRAAPGSLYEERIRNLFPESR